MTNQLNLQQRHAVVTGAASGLGFAIANRLLASGARLTLWDRDPKGLEQAARSLQSSAAGSVVNTFTVDVASHASVAEAARHTQAIAPVDILVNSAGISGVNAKLWEYPIDAWEQIIDINLNGTFLCCRELVPGMRERNYGRIVNIASAAGLISNPKMSVYAASKWALIGWGDSVRLELKREGHANVKLTTVAPTYISTGMFDGARGPLMTPLMKPDYVVSRVWKAMRAGKPMLMLPWTVHLSKFVKGVLPQRAFDVIADKVFHVYSSMDNFRGR
jgi:short-subunit dehydrogenase